MIEAITLVNATTISQAINLFTWMDKDRVARRGEEPARLLDNGPAEPLLLTDSDYPRGNPRYAYPRTDVETLCNLGFLRHDSTELKLTEKTERLLEAHREREADKTDLAGAVRDWIVVAHEEVFIDEGASPPNLRALIGGEWNPGDRIVITSHDPEHALVRHLPLALAASDPMFIADLEEVTEDFRYADAEVDAY